jgi:hypothetical protein
MQPCKATKHSSIKNWKDIHSCAYWQIVIFVSLLLLFKFESTNCDKKMQEHVWEYVPATIMFFYSIKDLMLA